MSGRVLAAARKAAGITSQAELGKRVGATQQTVQRWESGEPMTMANLVNLVQELPELDPLEVIYALWPAIMERDPIPASLRDLLRRATPAQRKRIEQAARREVDGATRVVRRRTIPEADHRELGGA